MGTRFTHKNLDQLITAINKKNADDGITMLLVTGASYGCSQLYEATPEQAAKFCYNRQLESGRPIECYHAAMRWTVDKLREITGANRYYDANKGAWVDEGEEVNS